MTTDMAARFLISSGLILVAIGIAFWLGQRLGFGKLPGDISIQRDQMYFSFPIVSCLLVSVLMTIVLNLITRR